MRGRAAVHAPRVRLQLGVVVAALIIWSVMSGAPGSTPAAAASTCNTSGPSGNAYTVTLCITAPDAGSTLTGSTTVSSTVSVTGTNPGVQELVYTLNGSEDLLWDFQAPYTWVLDSTRWLDGNYSLQVDAIMRDGFTTPQTTESLTFSNGITSPPVNRIRSPRPRGRRPHRGSPSS